MNEMKIRKPKKEWLGSGLAYQAGESLEKYNKRIEDVMKETGALEPEKPKPEKLKIKKDEKE